jgi:hypothetical protein
MDEIQVVDTFRAELSRRHPEHMHEARAELRVAMRPETDAQRYHRRRRVRERGLAAAGVLAVGAAVALLAVFGGAGNNRQGDIAADAAALFPYDTASDVVSYADQIALVTAVSSADHPDENVDPEQAKADGWMVGRDITFHVDQVVWHRDGAPLLTGDFSSLTAGWWVRPDGTKHKFKLGGTAWVELGDRFLAPLALDNGAWSMMWPFDTFPVKGGVLAPLDTQHGELADRIAGLDLAKAGQVFAAARPDPLAARHFDLGARARARAVSVDRRQAGG